MWAVASKVAASSCNSPTALHCDDSGERMGLGPQWYALNQAHQEGPVRLELVTTGS